MASDDEYNRRESHNKDDENPFIAFRRYADEQMSSLLQGVIGLPSALSSHSSNNRWIPYDQEMRRRGPSTSDSSSYSEGERSLPRKSEEAEAVEIPVRRYNKDSAEIERDVSEGLRCPYRPRDQDSLAQPKGVSDSERSDSWERPLSLLFPPRTFLYEDSTSPGSIMLSGPQSLIRILGEWPVAYVVTNPYSPLHLEKQQLLKEYGTKWRNAFEDLLAVQSGREMVDNSERNAQRDGADWAASMVDQWLFSSMKRVMDRESRMGSVARKEFARDLGNAKEPDFSHDSPARLWDLIQHVERTRRQSNYTSTSADEVDARHPENDAEDNEFTELDLYERFLGSQGQFPPAITPESSPQLQSLSTPRAVDEEGQPSIISTLTTTERKILPDGTVHTKVMLKKRFADGREESTETVHTAQDGLEQTARSSPATSRESSNVNGEVEGQKTKEKEEKKKGWFWS
ncbi:hypothetical protein MMC14_008603 [Varicellaria rhodocarpa]|nr:hypothetical protein [Varicellaria rhodocarpa]